MNVLVVICGLLALASAQWENLPAMPTALGEVACVIIDRKIYLVGESFAKRDKDLFEKENCNTYYYDLDTSEWTVDEQDTREECGNHHAALAYKGKMYLFGGLKGGNSLVQIFDPKARAGKRWRSIDLPEDYHAGSAIAEIITKKEWLGFKHTDMVLMCGGIDERIDDTVSTCYYFRLDSEKFEKTGDMPRGANHAASATDGHCIYVFGGRDGKNKVTAGFGYTQEWCVDGGWKDLEHNAQLEVPRGGVGKAIYVKQENKYFVFGGETSEDPEDPDTHESVNNDKVVDRVDIYDPEEDMWKDPAPIMAIPRHGTYAVLDGDYIYVAGGGTKAGFSGVNYFDRISYKELLRETQ